MLLAVSMHRNGREIQIHLPSDITKIHSKEVNNTTPQKTLDVSGACETITSYNAKSCLQIRDGNLEKWC